MQRLPVALFYRLRFASSKFRWWLDVPQGTLALAPRCLSALWRFVVPSGGAGRLQERRDGCPESLARAVILRLLIANALELAVGVGVVSALRLPIGTAYLAGLAVVGIVSAHLALVRVEVGWTLLVVFAAVSLLAAYLRRPDTLPRVGRGSVERAAPRACSLLAAGAALRLSRRLGDVGDEAKALYLLAAPAGLFASRAAQLP